MTSNLLALALFVLSGTSTRVPAAASRYETPVDPGYRIGPEDVLQVSVWNNEAMSRTAPIRPDGKISLPLLNDVDAAGLTPMELRERLMQRLAEYMPHPKVSVVVTEVRSFKVSIIGEIKTPGRYEFKSRTTVLDALAQAGAFTNFASPSRIYVLRPNGSGIQQIPFNYKRVIATRGGNENFFLEPGDIIVVP